MALLEFPLGKDVEQFSVNLLKNLPTEVKLDKRFDPGNAGLKGQVAWCVLCLHGDGVVQRGCGAVLLILVINSYLVNRNHVKCSGREQ